MPALLVSDIPADPTGWWISEKYDGVRAIWDGEDFCSRSGRVLRCPQWFRDGMPDHRLDGELWMGRQSFPRLLSVIQSNGSDWHGVMFMAFEPCDMTLPIEARISILRRLELPAHVEAVAHVPCACDGHLNAMEREVVDGGGEGLVIRRPGSMYRPGRAGDVVKVKRLVADLDRWQG